MENTSGQGKAATVPGEIDKWNWGAFLLNWIWGIGNNTLVALLMFIPFVNFVMIFMLGSKGSSWAWRNKRWDSIEQFHAVQRRWAKWGIIIWLGAIPAVVAMFFAISASMKSTEAFKLAVGKLETSDQVVHLIGKPITTGMPMGEIQVSGPSGAARLSFGVEGPNGKGTAFVEASKRLGQWKIEKMAFEQEGTGRRVYLSE